MTITDTGIGQSALRELSLSLRQLVGEDSILHFAQQVGIPDITLRKYLDGVQPTADNRHLAAATGVNLNWILTGQGSPYLRK